ncbi:ATP-binding protein [Achromobacter anxifer]|uniref:ATP-binding protein n=2 Tax=Achromobacter anxifer TaxID=1287737 RepID=UPI00215881CC|nr:ATP-binding protein [Achromobacter anxifer]
MNVPAEARILALWDDGSQSRAQALAQACASAEALARETGLELRRVDLSSIVGKYIGETEKNLRRLFEATEASGAILLFDEADALFGKRPEVRDSHDRYANIEVSYQLQGMESYRGLAMQAANLKCNLDDAFLRRLRLVVQFPVRGPRPGRRIWSRAFPAAGRDNEVTMARLLQGLRAEADPNARPQAGAKATRGYP